MRRCLILMVLAGCGSGGDDDDDTTALTCDTVPACYSDALDALRSCVPLPDFALGTVNAQ